METFGTIYILILFVFGVLNIILFFKIWGMTNNISEMNHTLSNIEKVLLSKKKSDIINNDDYLNKPYGTDSTERHNKFSLNDSVVIKMTGKLTHITKITDEGKYVCYSSEGSFFDGVFEDEQLFTRDEYTQFLKNKRPHY